MTVTLRPFKPKDLLDFDPQPRQVDDYAQAIDSRHWQYCDALTAFAGGRAVVVAGMAPIWSGRAIAWALVSRHAGPHMRALTRAAIGVFEACEYARVELYVDVEWAEAQRWARLLGFQPETPRPLQACLPGGADAFLYARIKTANTTAPAASLHEQHTAALH
jgi:hypothetical protein